MTGLRYNFHGGHPFAGVVQGLADLALLGPRIALHQSCLALAFLPRFCASSQSPLSSRMWHPLLFSCQQ